MTEKHTMNVGVQVLPLVENVYQVVDKAIEHPDEAADILVAAVPELNADLVKASQEWLSPYYQAEAPRWGEQKESVWRDYTNWMVEHGILKTPMAAADAFTNKFLP